MVIILSISILSVALQDVIIYIGFKVNQNYIAQNLCVNIDDIASTCHGTCYLQDQLSESKEAEKHEAVPIPGENSPTLPDPGESHRWSQLEGPEVARLLRITNDGLFQSDYYARTFHPPKELT